ncbi:MAG: biotin transporter BioY [Spirochaetia bacterium]|nr:biotin transporter BioY [Spirochaetia bacterium]
MIKALTADVALSREQERSFLVIAFALITLAAAMVKVYTPFSPVPFTLQTLALYFSVYYLNSGDNGISQALYICLGLVGAPVFAAGLTGAVALVGPTAGYLIGFVAAAVFMSYAMSKVKKAEFLTSALIFTAGSVILLTLGTLHLALTYRMGLAAAFKAGFLVFVPAEACKIVLAAAAYRLKK